MKKWVFFIIVLLVGIVADAQIYMIEKFGLSATGGEYGIYADIDTHNDELDIFFDWESPNGFQKARTRISFKKISGSSSDANTEVEKFISALEQSKAVFEAWSVKAKENKLSLLTRRIPVSFADQFIFFSQNDAWYSEKGVDIKTTFFVDRNGNCYLILESDYMTSEEVVAESSAFGLSYTGNLQNFVVSSGYSKVVAEKYCPGASLTFSSMAEIDNFITKLRKVVEWKKKNLEAGKLFK